MESEPFRIAAVQASSVFLNLDATVEKACRLIEEAARAGATLVAFPEAFVSGYPVWVWLIPSGQTHALRTLYTELVRSAVSIPDPAVSRLAEAPTTAMERGWRIASISAAISVRAVSGSGIVLPLRRSGPV